jgi:PAS domain S-box-containing protein
MALEVTRRRHAEQSLKSNEKLFQEIFKALPIAVVTATPDRKIERLNPAAERLFGYHTDDIRGSLTEILYNDKKQFELIGEKHGLANGLLTTDLILKKSDGSVFLSESICTKAYDQHGNVVGLVGIHADITEQQRAEELKHRHEKILQTMIDTAPVQALMLDSDLNAVFANKRFADHLKIQINELIGAHTPELVKDCPLRGHRLANVQLVLDTGIPLTFIDQENDRWLEHYLAPLEYTNSKDKRVAIFMHDITDRMKQEELEREKIAEELREVVSEMLEKHENGDITYRDQLKGKSLTPREMEVLKEVASGLSTKQISVKHKVSTKTIESQRLSIMRKLSLYNVADLTKYAIREGMVNL